MLDIDKLIHCCELCEWLGGFSTLLDIDKAIYFVTRQVSKVNYQIEDVFSPRSFPQNTYISRKLDI